jgi:hypothetical protein
MVAECSAAKRAAADSVGLRAWAGDFALVLDRDDALQSWPLVTLL